MTPTPGFHNPLLLPRKIIFDFLSDFQPEQSLSSVIFDPEELYYFILRICAELAQIGFVSQIILLDKSLVMPGGLETAATAMHDLGLAGWVGNVVDLTTEKTDSALAFEENRDFGLRHPVHGIRGFQYLVWNENHPFLESFTEHDLWQAGTVYLQGLRPGMNHRLLKKIPAGNTIFCDAESYKVLRSVPVKNKLVILSPNTNAAQFRFCENPLTLSGIQMSLPSRSERNSTEFQLNGIKAEEFSKMQCHLQNNFKNIYPDSEIENLGLATFRNPTEFRNAAHLTEKLIPVDSLEIGDRQIIKEGKFCAIDAAVIKHEFDHVIRKIKRQF